MIQITHGSYLLAYLRGEIGGIQSAYTYAEASSQMVWVEPSPLLRALMGMM
jgi:hypothetical protein